MLLASSVCVLLIGSSFLISAAECQDQEVRRRDKREVDRLLLITATANEFDERFVRFNKSVAANKLDLVVLGTNEGWISGRKTAKGLEKIDLLKKALESYKNEEALLVLWLPDSYNVIVNGNKAEILERFNKFDGFHLSSLDSFIGFAPKLWSLLSEAGKAEGLEARKDDESRLFLSVESESDFELDFSSRDSVRLKNNIYKSEPVIVLANAESQKGQILLNSLGNYLGKAWTPENGCRDCNATKISLANVKDSQLPSVLIGLFIEEPTPFLEDFFETLILLNYPPSRLHLLLHNSVEFHNEQIARFLKQFANTYASLEYVPESAKMLEWEARNYCLEKCRKLSCDYYLSLDSVARLDEPNSLRILIEANKNVIAPLLTRPQKLWWKMWGAQNGQGYYSRSQDYVQLVKMERRGIWSVVQVMDAYLINGDLLRNFTHSLNYLNPKVEQNAQTVKPIYAFSHNLRKLNQLQYMINTHDFGHLVDPTSYNISLKHPDFYQLSSNMLDWEQRYLHDNYSEVLEDHYKIEQPCQDVFWFPVVNDLFCKQAIEIMESYGKWSGGTNDDPRLEGGYESVPTRDIHLKQVGLHDLWLTFLREYVMPVQLKEYIGYEHDPPRADLAFVVRYHPAEQASLRPHHDSSTYTMNIALNSPGADYEGGGCRFVRYNCSVTESRRGWALLHPGRLTHYHEGLPVTNGTRYILVTFIDP